MTRRRSWPPENPERMQEIIPPAPPVWLCLMATLGGLVVPAAAAVLTAVTVGAEINLHRASGMATLAVAVVAAALVAVLLMRGAWRLAELPGSGPADFLPYRWLRRRSTLRRAARIITDLERLPTGPSQEAVGMLLTLASLLAAADPYERRRPKRRAELCAQLSESLGLSRAEGETALLASYLMDLGLLGIPSTVLHERGPLGPEDSALVRMHPTVCSALLAPFLPPEMVAAVRGHHERVDGRGYPDGLAGDDIPLVSRLLAAVDTYDALISDRPYRRGRPPGEAFSELRAAAGPQLDPSIVETLIATEARSRGRGGLWLASLTDPFRRFEHFLRGSAVPAAAGVTALTVAALAWTGQLSASLAGTYVATSHPAVAADGPKPSPSPSPASPPKPPQAVVVAPPAPVSPVPPATHAAIAPWRPPVATHPATSAAAPPATKAAPTPASPAPGAPSNRVVVPSTTGAAPSPSPSPIPPPPASPTRAPSPSPSPSPIPPPPASAGPAATIIGISPSTSSSLRGGLTVSITGSGFMDTTAVMFGTRPATNVLVMSDDMMLVTVPRASAPGPVEVVVITPAGPSDTAGPVGTGDADDFTYQQSSGGGLLLPLLGG